MTEAEWLACSDPEQMVQFLRCGPLIRRVGSWVGWHWPPPSDRKLRLWACACARRLWHLLPHEASCRAIFGPLPFRRVTVADAWLTPTVIALARGINEDRRFTNMPVLADALEESGCDDADVLNHCRLANPHGRGCWVLEAIFHRPSHQ